MTYRAEHTNPGSPEFQWQLNDDAGEMVGPCMTELEAKELAAGINLLRAIKATRLHDNLGPIINAALKEAYG